jgi:hypothetical protein
MCPTTSRPNRRVKYAQIGWSSDRLRAVCRLHAREPAAELRRVALRVEELSSVPASASTSSFSTSYFDAIASP